MNYDCDETIEQNRRFSIATSHCRGKSDIKRKGSMNKKRKITSLSNFRKSAEKLSQPFKFLPILITSKIPLYSTSQAGSKYRLTFFPTQNIQCIA